jgi:hypothetical protein
VQESCDNMTIITIDILSKAIANKIGISIEEARRDASFILDIFGFQDRVIDILLDPEDRQLFYILEEEGMLTTEREETILYDGREWRTHYWVLKKNIILKYAKDKSSSIKNGVSNKSIWDKSDGSIYGTLPNDFWSIRSGCQL